MSFYTALTGLNAASAQLGVSSNNIANVGTIGFKKSRAQFGDIFATSPLQKNSSVVGQGVNLKEISQVFSQGNIVNSANSLDLAVSGQGFFALKPNLTSNQTVYTRNGGFSVNNDRYVVDSVGQFLQVFPVNEDGSVTSTSIDAAGSLQLPETSGEPKASSQLLLGVNLPADAEIIPQRDVFTSGQANYEFDRNDPDTYNKATSITVFDSLGNASIATIYYYKTQNASAQDANPSNKWQTRIFIGDREIEPALLKAKNEKNEVLYINKFGQISADPAATDPTFNPNAPHRKYTFDEQSAKVPSQPGTFTGAIMTDGFDFGDTDTNEIPIGAPGAGDATTLNPQSLFFARVDGGEYRLISLPADTPNKLTGSGLANALTLAMNDTFGDEKFFDFANDENASKFKLTIEDSAGNPNSFQIDLELTGSNVLPAQIKTAIEEKLALVPLPGATGGETLADAIEVSYDLSDRSISFRPSAARFDRLVSKMSVVGSTGTADVENKLLGFAASVGSLTPVGSSTTIPALKGEPLVPNGEFRLDPDRQRAGLKVEYRSDERRFVFSSGTTGENSEIDIQAVFLNAAGDPVSPEDIEGRGNLDGLTLANARAVSVFGFSEDAPGASAGTGLAGTPATTKGSRTAVDTTGTFRVSETDNRINVTVDGISGSIKIPSATYTASSFAAEIQTRINLIEAENGQKVSGVKVSYDPVSESFEFTSATTSDLSFINVNGHPNWGLAETTQVSGNVPDYTILKQATDADGNFIYIDREGNETLAEIDSDPNWSPLYLDKGELTFDTSGRLLSPREGAAYTPFDPENGADPIVLNVDYGTNSTQFSQPFSVLSLSQDGFASGKLDGLDIDSSGVVRANYTNGQQVALGKIILTNFANPNGLKQIGNANYLETATSGIPSFGEAGGDGFGSIQAGALERANVDLTEELVELITAQRNFQANAKAIETSSTLTQTIINIRS